jgi:hypothetical protein
MEIDGVKVQYQLNEYKTDIMTSPIWQLKEDGSLDPDYIYDYACFITAGLNARNHYHKIYLHKDDYMNLREFNQKMRNNEGYEYLYYKKLYSGNVELMKQACYGRESFSRHEIYDNLLEIKEKVRNYTGIIDFSVPNEYFLIKTRYLNTGHYSWLIGADHKYVDSYDGKIKYANNNILEIIKVVF